MKDPERFLLNGGDVEPIHMRNVFCFTLAIMALAKLAPFLVNGAESARPLLVDGTVRFRSFARDNRAVIDEIHSFQWRGVGCKWTLNLSLDRDKIFDYHVLTYDGDMLFAVSSLESANERARAKGEDAGSDFTAVVLRSAVPRLLEGHEAASIWLTYGSGCYLGSRTNDLAEPPYSMSDSRRSLPTGAEWLLHFTNKWLDRENGVTSEVAYWDTMPGSRSLGFVTNAIYTVLGSSEVDGKVVPTNSVLRIFSIPGIDGPQRLLYEYDLSANSISVKDSIVIPLAKLPGVAFVSDFRFAQDPATPWNVHYNRRGAFPTEEEVRALPMFETQMADNRRNLAALARLDRRDRSGIPRLGVWPILVLLTAALGGFSLWISLNKRKRKQLERPNGVQSSRGKIA